MGHWRLIACVALGLFWAASLPVMASAHQANRPNLSVSSGSITEADGKLVGKLVVLNKGPGSAAKSSAALVIQAAGKAREVGRFPIPPLGPGAKKTARVAVAIPSDLPSGPSPVKACADPGRKVHESAEGDNCRKVGVIQIAPPSTVPPLTSPTPAPTTGPPGQSPSAPTNPIPFTAGKPAQIAASGAAPPYWLYVPRSYDSSHETPTKLFVWLHGCSGFSSGDILKVDPEAGQGTQDWISVGVGGREGDCWDVNVDGAKVLATIADVKSHFNIDPHRVILGGYSSGGDLAYRTAFYNSSAFAGLLVENSAPFQDTGSSQSQSLTAATTKFHVVHLAHTGDTSYQIDHVRAEVKAMSEAGFPISLVERPGEHNDGTTDPDLVTYLLPHIDDGWLSP